MRCCDRVGSSRADRGSVSRPDWQGTAMVDKRLKRLAGEASVGQRSSHLVTPILEAVEQLADCGVINRPALRIGDQIALADIGDVGRILVLGQQVVKRLIAARANVLGDRLVPFVRIGEDRVNIEHHPAKGEKAVANHIANAEAGTGLARRDDRASGLARKELCTFHGRQYGASLAQNKHVVLATRQICPNFVGRRVLASAKAWANGLASCRQPPRPGGPHSVRRASRRGGRVVECAALEMRFTGDGNVGSNPTLSARHPSASVQKTPVFLDF
jgi:hypothetical protein